MTACATKPRNTLHLKDSVKGNGMKSEKNILLALNKVLYRQLTAINQYFMHGKILQNQGVSVLSKAILKASINEMKYADKLMERILFLEGLPNLQDLGKLMIGESVEEILQADLKMQHKLRDELVAGIDQCENAEDFISRAVLTQFLRAEEDHLDWLETQLSLIADVGIENYIQTAAHGD